MSLSVCFVTSLHCVSHCSVYFVTSLHCVSLLIPKVLIIQAYYITSTSIYYEILELDLLPMLSNAQWVLRCKGLTAWNHCKLNGIIWAPIVYGQLLLCKLNHENQSELYKSDKCYKTIQIILYINPQLFILSIPNYLNANNGHFCS